MSAPTPHLFDAPQPTAEDLEDPAGYAGRRTAADASTDSLDDDLRKLLEGGFGDAPKEG